MAAILSQLLGYRLFPGELMNQIITVCNNLTGNGTPQSTTASNLSFTGTLTGSPQLIQLTTGTTQGTATAITKSTAIITAVATSSTHGVRLPTAATGLIVRVLSVATTFSAKVYPATNGKIGGASTNAADTTLLVKNKGNIYVAVNTNLWAVMRGA